ncbi:hypothetical protein BVY04_05360 [bacterium M21]|nr:hypothetical protein BVY04_05360 [bacterium M21]
MTYETEQPKKSVLPWVLGCFGGGCLLMVIAVVVASVIGYNFVTGLVADTPSVEIPVLNPEKVEAVEQKFEAYTKKVDEAAVGEEVGALVLDADELNAMLGDFFKNLPEDERIRVKVMIEGDEMTGDLSMPIGTPEEPKWINGKASFTVTIKDGVADIRVAKFSVEDMQVPESFMAGIKEENMAKDLNKDPEMRKNLKRVKKFEIKDGKIYVELLPDETPSVLTEEPVSPQE